MNLRLYAEDWLSVLLWGADQLMVPTLRNLTETYEAWEYRNRRWNQQIRRLEQRQLITRTNRSGQIVYQLTQLGRLTALGGRDPVQRWQRSWDGQWRMVVFDLPVGHQKTRHRLLRWLRQNGFGYLQDSVWIHTDPVTDLTEALEEFRDDVETFTILEARCCAGYSNAALVKGAWSFREMNDRYQQYLEIATAKLEEAQRTPSMESLAHWLHQERSAWHRAMSLDPLLPSVLHPPDYLGPHAWSVRRRAFIAVAEQFAALK